MQCNRRYLDFKPDWQMSAVGEITIKTDDLHWLTKDQAWHYNVLPKSRAASGLTLYCENSADRNALQEELEVLWGTPVTLDPIEDAQVSRLLSKYYLKENAASGVAE